MSKHEQALHSAIEVSMEAQGNFTTSIIWVGLSVIVSALAGVLASVVLA